MLHSLRKRLSGAEIMTVSDYIRHYFSLPDAVIFFGIALGLVILCNLILFLFSQVGARRHAAEEAALHFTTTDLAAEKAKYVEERFLNLTERFYEIVFSGNCILFFMTVYYLIYRFYETEPYKSLFLKYDSFCLLVLIVLSCVLNTLLDRVFIRLTHLDDRERGAIKILGMLYMLIIFGYIKFIYEDDNYDMFITYFLGLMVGRFVYFDASFKDFLSSMKSALASFPIMLLALGCTGAMAWWGFGTKYLIKHIGVVTNVFIAHIFLVAAIFLIFHLHPERLLRSENKP